MADLITFARDLIDSGASAGWQSFGQGSGWEARELGQDIGLSSGTPIPGVDGMVAAVDYWGGQADYAVTLRLGDGTLLTVGHVAALVGVGQRVTAGQIIATSRGLPSEISSGPHIEIRVQPAGGGYVDPVPWLHSSSTVAASSPATPAGGSFDPRTAVVLLALVFGASFGGDILDWLLD